MTAAWWIAHVLAMHLSVPEPVTVTMTTLWPTDNTAQISRVGAGWEIQVDRAKWKRLHRNERLWILAHELCHAAYNDDQFHWQNMTPREQKQKHKQINKCETKIMRDHEEGDESP